jgi:hypothetical protein
MARGRRAVVEGYGEDGEEQAQTRREPMIESDSLVSVEAC